MATKQLYRQCTLERATAGGVLHHVAWLPTQFARVDKKVQIDSLGDHLWKVIAADSNTRTVDDLDQQRDAHKRFESVLK